MCLIISQDQSQNKKDLKKWFGNRTKFAYVYKVLAKRKGEDFYRSACFPDFRWDFSKEKVFEVDRSLNPTLLECSDRQIDKGLHVYTNLEEAKAECSSYNYYVYHFKVKTKSYRTIVKFRVNKEDIVAVQNGCYWERQNLKEAVCAKLTFIKIIKD